MNSPPKKRIFELYNYALIQKSCQIALEYSNFFTLVGNSGVGKTLALKSFKVKYNDSVKYIEVGESMTATNFFRDIAIMFDCQFRSLSINAYMNWIKSYVNEQNKKQLLIVDEAGRFNSKQYSYLQELRNLTEHNLGIILSGPHYFIKKIKNWHNRDVEGIPEFFRRINKLIFLEPLSSDEIIGICEAYGIKSKKVIRDNFINTKAVGRLITDIENYLFYDKAIYDF